MFFRSDRFKCITVSAAIALMAFYILSAGGCDFGDAEFVKETSEPAYISAKQDLAKGDTRAALENFLKVVEKRVDAPESHLELGKIYLEDLNDPIMSIYHFRKYLELIPNTKQSELVRGLIETAQKKFQFSLPGSQFDSNLRTMELEEIVKKVQAENLELKQKLAASEKTVKNLEATQKVSIAPSRHSAKRDTRVSDASNSGMADVKTVKSNPTKASNTPSSYIVQPGDTLSSISRKVYGTPNRWRDIFKANRDKMATPESLKPGQTLKVP